LIFNLTIGSATKKQKEINKEGITKNNVKKDRKKRENKERRKE
jgi:hypothetical protein